MALFDLFKRKKPVAADELAGSEETQPAIEAAPEPQAASSTAPRSQPGRLRAALNRTRAFLATTFATDPAGLVDEAYFDELVEALVLADAGPELAARLVARIRRMLAERGKVHKSDVPPLAREIVAELLSAVQAPAPLDPQRLSVILLVGVNGSGKTTLAAKLAHRLKQEGRSVLLAAADTFRAAAVEQLQVWAARAGVEIVSGQTGADPAAVVFDAAQAAQSRSVEVLIIDTAGRLQTKHNLMQELEKIVRTVEKASGASAQIAHLLVLDATVGQNALSQAELFNACCPLTGLAVTKLDGTAKGGAVLAVVDQLKIPVLYAGVGEQLDDLLDFDAQEFAAGLFAE